MRYVMIVLTMAFLCVGCTGLDRNVGTHFEHGIEYHAWVKGYQSTLNYRIIDIQLDDYRVDENHDTLTFTVIRKEAPAKYRSFNSNLQSMPIELKFHFYLLDQGKLCYDKVYIFKRFSRLPGTFEIDVPHDSRLQYFRPRCEIRWYVQH